jgi:acyl-homoserine lactone acylase PvdQ
MRKLFIIFWLIFWLFIYKLAFLEKDAIQTDHEFTIYRDGEGIPHIYAKSYKDIFFGLGYA